MGEKATLPDLMVIGAGLSRTGTLSTRAALEHLLGGPCYHGAVPLVEREEHCELWTKALELGTLDVDTAKKLLAGYKAGVDHPVYCFYKDLLQMNPSAKVLLTVRDPKGWYASANLLMNILDTITSSLPYSWFLMMVGMGRQIAFLRSVLHDRMYRALRKGEDEAINFFNDHVAEVKAAVPPHQLLVFNVKEGWEPLCKFLDCPVPSIPFPNINDRRQVLMVFNIVKAVTWMSLLCLPVLMFIILPYCQNLMHLVVLTILGLVLFWGSGCLCSRVVRKHTEKSKMK